MASRALALSLLLCACENEPLSYALPTSCPVTYRMRVDSEGTSQREFLFRIQRQNESRATAQWIEVADDAPARRRSLDLSPQAYGPAAPDAACRDRLHDPFEDFVAWSFPSLKGSGDHSWGGSRVIGDGSTCREPGSCCAALASWTPENERSKLDPAAAQLGSWVERRRPSARRDDLLTIESRWENGRKGPASATAQRFVVFDAARGRVLESVLKLQSGAHGELNVEILAFDQCDGIQPLARDPQALAGLARLAPTDPKP